jgi:hypothetical protein
MKVILQVIPSYLLSVFPLQRNFLWRGAEDKKKWALVAWEKL